MRIIKDFDKFKIYENKKENKKTNQKVVKIEGWKKY